MCGIAGFLLRDRPAPADLIRQMCDRLVHRGPDDEGILIERSCAIGMRRLSIIDVSGGHQPITNEEDSVAIVFNGEIYNFRELRAALEAKGHRFRTHSDTEVLLHLYEEDGAGMVARLRGMFAFAIWDSRTSSLFLARDRFGKKPLFYADTPTGFYFASELDALRAAPIPLEVDRDALRMFFQFGWIAEPYSAFRAVRKLEAGTWMRAHQDGRTERGRYWSLPRTSNGHVPQPFPPRETLERLRDKFDEAVRIRLLSDVPLGAFLSGGIDSSSVVASMARQTGSPVKTFAIGFREPAFNELEYAGLVAKAYGTEHHEILVEPDAVSLASRLSTHFGEPFGDSSAIPTYLVSEFAARHVKVALSGDGGDEIFGGYDSFLAVERHRTLDRVPLAARQLLAVLAELLPYATHGKNYLRMLSRSSGFERYVENTFAPHFMLAQLLRPEWVPPCDEAYLTRMFAEALCPASPDTLTRAMYFEATAKLSGDMLTKVDRASMAASLEVRCPFLDHELAELAATYPNHFKVAQNKGKRVFLAAMQDRLPPAILTRSKMGFGVPLADWFRGPLREFLRDHLRGPGFRGRDFVSEPFLDRLLDEHARQRRDNSHWLWSLLMLELWLRDLPSRAA